MLKLDSRADDLKKPHESQRNEKRKKFFSAQDEIDGRKEEPIDGIETRMEQRIEERELLVVRWELVHG